MTPVLIAGPTATGKSDIALALAERIGGEIVTVDSMQVYRGMDIGTAKPAPADLGRVRHHLLDIADPSEAFDAAKFVAAATLAVADIQSRGSTPILCGGTGLYFNAWLNGLGAAPPPDPALRRELEETPLPALLDELARRDWTTFDEIDPSNRRRVVRAVEVIRLTGKPFSGQRARWPERAQALAGRSFGIARPMEDITARIRSRVDAMFRAGLVEETRALLARGLAANRTAMQAIGYRQVAEQLAGERGLLETVELVKVRTRQFAKRQATWFRGQMDLRWIDLARDTAPQVAAEMIVVALGETKSPTA